MVFFEIETGKPDTKANIENCRELPILVVSCGVADELRAEWQERLFVEEFDCWDSRVCGRAGFVNGHKSISVLPEKRQREAAKHLAMGDVQRTDLASIPGNFKERAEESRQFQAPGKDRDWSNAESRPKEEEGSVLLEALN